MEDQEIREFISKMLGSYKPGYYSQEKEVLTLSWPEIYFELGKLKSLCSQLIDLKTLNENVDHLMEVERNRIQEIKNKLNS